MTLFADVSAVLEWRDEVGIMGRLWFVDNSDWPQTTPYPECW